MMKVIMKIIIDNNNNYVVVVFNSKLLHFSIFSHVANKTPNIPAIHNNYTNILLKKYYTMKITIRKRKRTFSTACS